MRPEVDFPSASVPRSKTGRELVEQQLFTLLRCTAKFELEIAQYFILQCRLPLCNDDAQGTNSLQGLIGNVGSWTGDGDRSSNWGSNLSDGSGRSGCSFRCSFRLGFCTSFILELVVDLLCVLGMAKNLSLPSNRVVLDRVFGFERASCHASQSGARTDFDEALENIMSKKYVLRLNPSDGRCELVPKKLEFDEDCVRQTLTMLGITPTFLV